MLVLALAALTQPALASPECAHVARKLSSTTAVSPVGSLHVLVVMTRFSDENGSEAPKFVVDLFDENFPGSLTHFYQEMSRGQFRLDGTVTRRQYESRDPGAAYTASRVGAIGDFARFAREVLSSADEEIDLAAFDNDGPDGIPSSGDDDGFVDFIFLIARSTPTGFFVGEATGISGLGLASDFVSDDRGSDGRLIRIRRDAHEDGPGGVLLRGSTFQEAAGSMAHEFGHALGLPDLFDRKFTRLGRALDPGDDSAGIGSWGLMGLGARGWRDLGGPTPLCAWSLEKLGWIGVANDKLVTLTADLDDATLDDVSAGGMVYKLPTRDPTTYYLVEHRAKGSSYYERDLPAEGILIWRVDLRQSSNDREESKLVDLVCADGLYKEAGFPLGTDASPQSGRDNLDFWAFDESYVSSRGGNTGDATDVFDGVRFTEFSAGTNPASLPGVSVVNIRRQGKAMVADLSLGDRRRAGVIDRDETWVDTVEVVGDIVVPAGTRLAITGRAVIRFGEDRTRSGQDTQLSELVIEGELSVFGTEAPIQFTSAAESPSAGDWGGIWVLPAGRVELRNAVIEYPVNGVAGKGTVQTLIMEKVVISRGSGGGVVLDAAEGVYRLSEVKVEGMVGAGIIVEGGGELRLVESQIIDNGGSGLVRRGGFLQIEDSELIDNGASESEVQMLLGSGVFGSAIGNRLRGFGGSGIVCDGSREVLIEANTLSGHAVAVVSRGAAPAIVGNTFSEVELALDISGSPLPSQVRLNAVEGSARLVVNRSEELLIAIDNWWGSADDEVIAAGMSGPVQWRPFLSFDPRLPLEFALRQNYPNPFNGSTTIGYAVAIELVGKGEGEVMSILEVRSSTGGLVRRLVNQTAVPGDFSVVWDGRDTDGVAMASGVYFYQLTVGEAQLTRKMSLIR